MSREYITILWRAMTMQACRRASNRTEVVVDEAAAGLRVHRDVAGVRVTAAAQGIQSLRQYKTYSRCGSTRTTW